MASEKLSVADALEQAEMIDRNLDAFEQTAPRTVAAMGGRDALAQCCEMTCVGPMPRLDRDTWERMSREYENRRSLPT